MSCYEGLDKDDLIHLLFNADTCIQALLDRDDAREKVDFEREKHAETQRKLEHSERIVAANRKTANEAAQEIMRLRALVEMRTAQLAKKMPADRHRGRR